MSFGEIWINVAWSTNKQTQESARWWSVSDVISLQACRTIEYWCLSLRGHCLCCQMIKENRWKFSWNAHHDEDDGGQTCSSWLLPGRHLKGFECDRLLLPCRALMGIFAESWMRAGQKILTRPWLIFYGLLVLWANVARWRKIIGPKSSLYFSLAQ